MFGKGDKLIEHIKLVTNKVIKPLATMTRDLASQYKTEIHTTLKESTSNLLATANAMADRVKLCQNNAKITNQELRDANSSLSSKRKEVATRLAAKNRADQAVENDTKYMTLKITVDRDQWEGLKTKKDPPRSVLSPKILL